MALNLSTIDYDRPVANYIAGLNATGHITHSRWKKTCVTFHHNGGRLSHQGCLNVWKTRPASAHFDVDSRGAVAQYANAYEYAWACGNTTGNQRSISIEMCNSTLAPGWQVSETTWKNAARLAGWLFANIIGAAPTSSNVLFHHDWLATACAGPYMDSVESKLLAEVQSAYNAFKGGQPTPKPKPAPTEQPGDLTVDGYLGTNTLNRWAAVMGTHTGKADLIKAVQTFLNAKGARDEHGNKLDVDGIGLYNNTAHDTDKSHTQYALQNYLRMAVRDGLLSSPSDCIKEVQRRLNKAKTGSKEF